MSEPASRLLAAPVPACVPAYFHPGQGGDAWRRLLAHPPRMVVLNLGDGPGEAKDPAFPPLVARLLAAGTEVLGYVDTDFGLRPVAEVRADLRRYRAWYGVRGVFLDQTAAGEDRLGHYREIVDGVRGTIVLNPGVYPDPRYADLADVLVTFDGPLSAYKAMREPAWARSLARGRFCHLVHDVPSRQLEPTMRRAVRFAGLAYATDRSGPQPWGDLPAYHGRPLVAG
ncbi:spherulation-specific family 4 protein [Nonomuraea sp. NPDC050310]|uniref:spherulation-specific family 4 protein n=1 Tax=Nonomuraea sp. NPDC050310 TaxID=3154935 RepID=UPI0033FEF540